MTDRPGALDRVRVLDLSDERGIYGAKLLADLGADVVRPEPPQGDPLRMRGPHVSDREDATSSLWYAFFASSRRSVEIDPGTEAGREQLCLALAWAEVVIDSGALEAAGIDLDQELEKRPELVVVRVTSFGPDGPWKDYLAPDLVAGALGGFCATTGDSDTAPLKGFGELNFMLSGAYTAIAVLAALHHAREAGEGQRVDVPVHECIASCLEQVLMTYWYPANIPGPQDRVFPRRGSLHWSNAYVVMQAVGGSIMVTPTPDLMAQIMWLVEDDAHEDLLDEDYLKPENVGSFIVRVMEVLRAWASSQDVETLFFNAQERHAPYGWVLPIERVCENPQLEARDWWVPYQVGDSEVQGPGAPYRLSETPWRLEAGHAAGADTASVLSEIGWEDAQ